MGSIPPRLGFLVIVYSDSGSQKFVFDRRLAAMKDFVQELCGTSFCDALEPALPLATKPIPPDILKDSSLFPPLFGDHRGLRTTAS